VPGSHYPSAADSHAHYPSGTVSRYPSGANSYYPPGVQSPRSTSYPPSAVALTSPALSVGGFSPTQAHTPAHTPAQTQPPTPVPVPFLLRTARRASATSSAALDDDDDDEVPEYEPGDAYALRVRRSGGKGVEFAVPDEVRRETARGAGTGSRRESAQSVLHPYVVSFTSPIGACFSFVSLERRC
jgi:hypothetical protein